MTGSRRVATYAKSSPALQHAVCGGSRMLLASETQSAGVDRYRADLPSCVFGPRKQDMILGITAKNGSPHLAFWLLGVIACGLAFGAGAASNRPLASALIAPVTPELVPAAPARAAYPAEVIRVVDGDTFEARVRIWPGLEVTTKVRLRGIDAPELSARCEGERRLAEAARDGLARMLGEGGVSLSGVGTDKYGGRVLAVAATARTPDVSTAMTANGWARPYAGGRRRSWCE